MLLILFYFAIYKRELPLFPKSRILCIKPAYYGLHYCPAHKLRSVSYPVAFAVYIQRTHLTRIQFKSQTVCPL